MRIGSLFAGIGGFDLAARWMGWETAWYSEIEPYACRVMEKNFPGIPNLGDIRDINGADTEPVDLLCGGFPCQDISQSATGWERPGIAGNRSGLWGEYARLIEVLRPNYILAENVEALRYAGRGLGRVLGDLASLGYDAEWAVLPASHVGAPHRRSRLWVVAYANRNRKPRSAVHAEASILSKLHFSLRDWGNPPRSIRVDDGVPSRVDRLRCLGNAVVPQIPYLFFRAIQAVEEGI